MTTVSPKRFRSVLALDNIDFDLRAGETHALLGINGAGKSTLVKIISGVYSSDAGKILMNDVEVAIREPTDAMGIGYRNRTAASRIDRKPFGCREHFSWSGGRRQRSCCVVLTGTSSERKPRPPGAISIEIDLSIKVENMSSVEREIVAILHALRQDNIKVLILDESGTSTLTLPEARKLFEVMETLKRSGIGIIYITHRLEE